MANPEEPKNVVCGEAVIAELFPRPHDQPEVPTCARLYSRYVLGQLALPPCAQLGYCIAVQLGE